MPSALALAAGGLNGYVFELLTRHLGNFITLSREQMRFSVWAGEGELLGVSVRADALLRLGVALRIRRGRAARIRITVPWHALRSAPIRITVTGLELHVHASADEPAQCSATTATSSAETGADCGKMSADGGESSEEGGGYLERMTAAMLANLVFELSDLAIHFDGKRVDKKRADKKGVDGKDRIQSQMGRFGSGTLGAENGGGEAYPMGDGVQGAALVLRFGALRIERVDSRWKRGFFEPIADVVCRRLAIQGVSISYGDGTSADSTPPGGGAQGATADKGVAQAQTHPVRVAVAEAGGGAPVSYTHLTLPTILLV